MDLAVWDFDGTLFGSPGVPDWWEGNLYAWWENLKGLMPPCIPAQPGLEWWNVPYLQMAKESTDCNNTYTMLLTGRTHIFEKRINDILATQNLKFDEFYLRPRHKSTISFKLGEIQRVLFDKNIKTIKIYDDREKHKETFANFIDDLPIPGEYHFVSTPAEGVVACNWAEYTYSKV